MELEGLKKFEKINTKKKTRQKSNFFSKSVFRNIGSGFDFKVWEGHYVLRLISYNLDHNFLRSFGEEEEGLEEGWFHALKRSITREIVKNNEEKLAYDIYLRCQCFILPLYYSYLPLLIND